MHRNRRALRLGTLLGALAATSCTTVQTHHLVTGQPAPAYAGPVGIFWQGAPLPARYEEVALVQVVGDDEDNLETLVPALQRRAAALGGNAVILVRVDQGGKHASATGVAVRLTQVTSGPEPGSHAIEK